MFCTDSAVAGCTANTGFLRGTGIARCLQAALLYQPADFALLPPCWAPADRQPPCALRRSILSPSPHTPRAEQRVPRLWATLIRVPMDALLAPARSCSAGGICPLLPPGLELHPALSPSISTSTQDHVQSHLWVLCCCSHSSRAWPVAQIRPASWALSRGAQDGNPSSAAPLAITGKSQGVLGGTC